jgi:Cofilin/tropomyosin-type actin-binding protein
MKSKLDENKILYGMFEVVGVDDRQNVTQRRYKYVFFSYSGPKAGGIKRARVGMYRGKVNQLFGDTAGSIAVDLQTDDPSDFDKKEISKSLLAAGAAHKPDTYDFLDGETFDLTTL